MNKIHPQESAMLNRYTSAPIGATIEEQTQIFSKFDLKLVQNKVCIMYIKLTNWPTLLQKSAMEDCIEVYSTFVDIIYTISVKYKGNIEKLDSNLGMLC